VKEVLVPDVNPSLLNQHAQMDPDIGPEGLMSMRAGSFDEIYPPADGILFDAVATTFFIDTTPNIFKTLSAIHASLKPGGLWLNFGPLLWHYESNTEQVTTDERIGGLEFALEDVISLISQFGFEFIKRESDIPVAYTASPRTMGDFQYRCEYWVVRKA
jgi:carnosine N-methyltransferase